MVQCQCCIVEFRLHTFVLSITIKNYSRYQKTYRYNFLVPIVKIKSRIHLRQITPRPFSPHLIKGLPYALHYHYMIAAKMYRYARTLI